ncbi:MAG TPA: tyrosine-type recombinase/integrase [Polyangiaceae bacterium]|nr:tyrosine-type recombinase/integrase [Polyangiaceae bacterium]
MNENRPGSPRIKPTKLTRRVLDDLPRGARVRDAGNGSAVGLFAERGQRGVVRLKVQADLRRPGERARTVRIDLGRWPDEIELDAARVRAVALVAEIKAGRDPRLPSPTDGAECWTVKQAWDAYAADLRKARGAGAERSAADLIARRDLYLATWLDRSLAEITTLECRDLHDQIIATVRSRARTANHTGERTANMVLKDVRAVFRLAIGTFPTLHHNPASVVRLAAERREHGLIELQDYPAWKVAVDALDSPVRRSLHRVALFSGLRSSNVRSMRRRWVDLAAGVVKFPGPEMKNREAFDMPVSKALGKLLEEALRVGHDARPESPFVFPAPSASGHVEVTRERNWNPGWYSHGLRHSYSNVCKLAGIDGDTRQLLLAQRVPGVRGTYLSAEQQWDRLKEAQERVSKRLLALIKGRE